MALGSQLVRKNLDYLSLALMYVLAGLSLFVIATATKPLVPASDPLYYVKRQLIWIALGTVVLIVATAIDYRKFPRVSPYLYWISVALLGYVMLHGHTSLGATRWIRVGSFQLQPSEFAKIAIIITLGTHLSRKKSLTRWRDLVSPLIHVLIPMALVLKQPDLGTTLVFVAITVGMFYMAGVPGLKLFILFPGGLALIILWIYLHGKYGIKIPMHHYQLQRLTIFLHPNSAPLGAGFNVIQSRIAVGTGGLTGGGLLANHSNLIGFLPESYTDFIFAAIGEELGFVGSIAILFIYAVLIARGVYIAGQAKDRLGTLLATGVVSLIAFHVIESAGMASGMMPVAGVPLPFVSYGGSAFLADSAGIGLLLNVYARRKHRGYGSSVADVPSVIYSDQAN